MNKNKTFKVVFSREYNINLPENCSDEYVIAAAFSELNVDLQWGHITADKDNFDVELIKDVKDEN